MSCCESHYTFEKKDIHIESPQPKYHLAQARHRQRHLMLTNYTPTPPHAPFPSLTTLLPHINNTPNTIPRLHIAKSLIDLIQRLPMCDELVDLELAVHVVGNESW
jgi:hypothetical protein